KRTRRTMNDQAFTTLEYGTLLTLIRRYAQTPMAQRRFESLVPFANLNELRRALTALSEAVNLKDRGVALSFHQIDDPENALARLRVEDAALDPLAILQLGRL